jgi:AsmA family protein
VLLRELGVAEAIIDGHADELQFSLQGQGRDWREFAAGAELQARMVGGNLVLQSGLQRPLAEIRLHSAAIGAAPGDALRVRLDGTLQRTPVQIEMSSGTLADLLRDNRQLPFALAARAAGTVLTLDGQVALPLGRDASLRLQMSGDRLESLGELSRLELPAWGPWSIAGPIRMTPAGYEVQDLQLRVGQSQLGGSGQLDLSGPRPHLALQVSAPSIQLDDFPLPKRLVDPHERPGPPSGLRGTANELAASADRLLSARFLRRVDASIDVQAKEVLAGTDRLADGAVRLRLREGRLDLDPAVVNLPGGSMRLSIAYDLKESELDFAVAAEVERFDYGIIARRLRRADDVRGLFSMKLRLQGRAPSLDTIMHHANGHLDVAVWPTELRAGVFNFWSVNLVLTLLPMIDPRAPSQVNCMVGRFDLKEGVVSDDKIVIDTTAVRIHGAGHANLATEDLSFVFRPRSKGIAVFRLQNPLRVTGTLTEQRIGLDPRDAVESTLRLIASPILWPIERFTLGPLPRDGADVCTDPLRAAAH